MPQLLSPGHSMCAGCGIAVAMHMLSRAAPEKLIVSMATGCLEVCTTMYPRTAFNVPVIHAAFETAASVASGIEAAVRKLGKDWKVMAIAGDGGTYDIGFQALSGMLERGHKVTFVCIDNECYANTGCQRSGATPFGASTTTTPPGKRSMGKAEWKKPLGEIAASHRIPYVASASVAYPNDLIAKARKAFEKQPSLLHVHCPCPLGWRFDMSSTIDMARLAVETGMWILYEIEDGKLAITKRVESRRPVEEYLKTQGRFRHLNAEAMKEIQARLDSEWERFGRIEKCGRVY